VAGRFIIRFALLTTAAIAAGAAHAADSPTARQSVTIAELFPPAEATLLSRTMRTDRRVVFHVRVPPGTAPHGVLVFVHPGNGAEPMAGWAEVLDRHNLAYVAAEGFGNDKPGAQRALAALLALKQLSRTTTLDPGRRYVGGMSGGGKIASQVLTRFPGFFGGALCIVGADTAAPKVLRAPDMANKRVVFMTGDRDFNHYDVLDVYKRFIDAGVTNAHLLDLSGFSHQYPDARQLALRLQVVMVMNCIRAWIEKRLAS
jgi:poly(3-hydroxybutyrate) depolymerase